MTNSASELRKYRSIIAVSATCLFFVFGVPAASLPFLYKSVIEEFYWTREQATLLGTFHWISGAIISLFIGRFIERLGVLRVMITTAVMSSLSMLSFRLTSSAVDFYLAGIGLGLSGFGMVTLVQVYLSRLFTERRGTAIGLALVGNSMAGLTIPLLLAPALETYAWDSVMAVLGAVCLIVVLPVCLVLLKRDVSYGALRQDQTARGNRFYWRNRSFWLISISLFLVAMVDGGLIQNTVLYLQVDKAIHYSIVGFAISSYHLASLLSRVVIGRLLDHFVVSGVVFVYLLVGLSALLAFTVQGPASGILFTLVRGVAHGGLIVSIPVLARHRFGQESDGRVIGILIALTTAGLAFGTFVLARLYAMKESYTLGFTVFCLIPIVAAIMLLPLRGDQRLPS